MQELLSGILSNDSSFGRLMTRIGVIVGANLMFVLFSFPIVTTGASIAALYYVMLKALRGDGELNPFREFWRGFRTNFRQATIVWVAAMVFAALAYFDVRITASSGGVLGWFRYPVYAICGVLTVLLLYFFPVVAAFEASIPALLRNSFFFVMRKPWKAIVILFFDIFPLYLTYTDPQMMPLYAFIWFFFGFGAVSMIGAALLLPEFVPYLDAVDAYGCFILDENGNRTKRNPNESSESEEKGPGRAPGKILKEMKKLGM